MFCCYMQNVAEGTVIDDGSFSCFISPNHEQFALYSLSWPLSVKWKSSFLPYSSMSDVVLMINACKDVKGFLFYLNH